MLEQAHAKVNLALSVTPGAREGGYHEVRTAMCALELHDDVELVELGPGCAPEFSCEPDPLPAGADAADNLAFRAALDMARAFGRPLEVGIHVRKAVPSQAGLGGGSSDAAAVVRGLARLWGLSLDDPRVVGVARALGADVAFFLHEVPSYLDGRGDVLRETYPAFRVPAVLVKPDEGVPTGACYRLLDEMATPAPQVEALLAALREGDAETALGLLANNMEPAALRLAPSLSGVFSFLNENGPWPGGPLLCGSGSCVCAFTADAAHAQAVAEEARRRGWWACATATLG